MHIFKAVFATQIEHPDQNDNKVTIVEHFYQNGIFFHV